MDGQLTYEALCANRHDLTHRFRDYIPLLTNRAQWQPEFAGTRAEIAHDYPQFLMLLNVYIIEVVQNPWVRRPQNQFIHLTYGITPNGGVSCITAAQATWNGAATAYQEPVERWVDAVKQRLQEEVSKRRIQTRAAALKEDLVAAVWRPDRLAKRLEEGGWDAIDAFAR